MATYSQSEKTRILGYPIVNLLAHFGKRTDHRGQMYYSPFRDERTPSFHINRNANVWMDFGSGEGGNVLTLVSQLAGISIAKSWDYIAALDPVIEISHITPHRQAAAETKVIIDNVSDIFTYRNLISYAESRGISADLLSKHCRQVSYHLSNMPQSHWTAIGFRSNDGWVLRHAGNEKFSKRCTSSACTFLNPEGKITPSPTHDHIEVFEGFFDYLSWLIMQNRDIPRCDVCVLNSVSNLKKGIDFISKHKSISCWMDNDIAGREAFEQIHETRKDSVGHMDELAALSCNDVNNMLMATSNKAKRESDLVKSSKEVKSPIIKGHKL